MSGDRLIWPLADPRVSDLALASLLETVNKFAQSAAEQPSNAAATEAAKQPTKAPGAAGPAPGLEEVPRSISAILSRFWYPATGVEQELVAYTPLRQRRNTQHPPWLDQVRVFYGW